MSKVILLSVCFQLLFILPLHAQAKVDLDYDKTFRQIFYMLYEVAEKSYHSTRPDSCDSFYNKLTLGWFKSTADYSLEYDLVTLFSPSGDKPKPTHWKGTINFKDIKSVAKDVDEHDWYYKECKKEIKIHRVRVNTNSVFLIWKYDEDNKRIDSSDVELMEIFIPFVDEADANKFVDLVNGWIEMNQL